MENNWAALALIVPATVIVLLVTWNVVRKMKARNAFYLAQFMAQRRWVVAKTPRVIESGKIGETAILQLVENTDEQTTILFVHFPHLHPDYSTITRLNAYSTIRFVSLEIPHQTIPPTDVSSYLKIAD